MKTAKGLVRWRTRFSPLPIPLHSSGAVHEPLASAAATSLMGALAGNMRNCLILAMYRRLLLSLVMVGCDAMAAKVLLRLLVRREASTPPARPPLASRRYRQLLSQE